MAGCARELSARADLTAYNTVEAMHDLDEVRAALGYEQWSLWGVSYGTKAARVYLRQYPKRVRVIALYGVVPIGDSMWTDLPANERRALAGILDRCREDQGCNTRYPGLADKLAALQARLAEKPASPSRSRRPMARSRASSTIVRCCNCSARACRARATARASRRCLINCTQETTPP